MPGIFEVDFHLIERLNALDLTKLLKAILFLESRKHEIMISASFVSLKIDVPDGGEDGRIEWSHGTERTSFISDRFTMYQSKAEKGMGPADFSQACLNTKAVYSEFLRKDSRIKPRLLECIEKKGTYTFFYGMSCNENQQINAIAAIRDTLREQEIPNVESIKIEIIDANRIADWCNHFVAAQTLVFALSKRPVPIGLRTWEQWQKQENVEFSFIEDDLRDKMNSLKGTVSVPKGELRVIGLPFMGKSRFVLESLAEDKSLQTQTVYCDAGNTTDSDIVKVVMNSVDQNLFGIVVVDNCSLGLHQQISKITNQSHSLISFISIGSDPEERNTIDRIDIIESSVDVIRKILRQRHGVELHTADFERIVEFAQGFPGMAVLLAKSRLKNDSNYSELSDDKLLDRLLGSLGAKEQARSVIQALALFKNVGFDENVALEREFVTKHFTKLSEQDFFGYSQDFINRKIVQRSGDYAFVVPRPLALRLAADWWTRCLPERALNLFKIEMPPSLTSSLAEQAKLLHYHPRVQSVAKELFGDAGPFSDAEVFITERGSRLFRSFATVAPELALDRLETVLNELTVEQLLTITGGGRRNLVRTLEKLCFKSETFKRAAVQLARLASAENETWSNNATGLFCQLFRVVLPGTAAAFDSRLEVIDEICKREKMSKIRILALSEGLRAERFSRMGGAEIDGSRPVEKDYLPRGNDEVYWYWNQCILRLIPFLSLENDLGDYARRQLADHLHNLISHRLFSLLDNCFDAIAKAPLFWKDGYEQILRARKSLQSVLSSDGAEWMSSLEHRLGPKDWPSQYRLYVCDADFHDIEITTDGSYIDNSRSRAAKFGAESASQWTEWMEHLHLLYEGKQNYGFDFGQSLGDSLTNGEEFLSRTIEFLKSVPVESVNLAVLGGFLRSSNQNKHASSVYDRMQTKDLIRCLVPLLCLSGPTDNDLNVLIELVRLKKIAIEQCRLLAYGSVLSKFPQETILEFVNGLSLELGGATVALDILFMYCFTDIKRVVAVREHLRSLLMMIDIASPEAESGMDFYHWEQSIRICSKHGGLDKQLVRHIAKQIMDSCMSDTDFSWDRYANAFKPLLELLLSEKYRDTAWEIIGPVLIEADPLLLLNMQQLFSNLFEPLQRKDQNSIIDNLPLDFVLSWCQLDLRASVFVARSANLFIEKDSLVVFRELPQKILELYGENDEVLRGLSMNLGSVGGVGSMEPQYRAQISALKNLPAYQSLKVRKWVQEQIEFAQREADFARKRYEEFTNGIYDS